MKELPKNFYSAKREFEKQFNFTIAKIKNEDKEKELENYAVLFGLIQEYNNFLMKFEEEVSVGIKDRMDELKKYKVYLGDFDKKLEWDEEAKWLYFSDMNSKDYTEDCLSYIRDLLSIDSPVGYTQNIAEYIERFLKTFSIQHPLHQ